MTTATAASAPTRTHGSAATALLRNEARLLARQPAVPIWTVILPVTAMVVMAAIPAARRPLDGFGGVGVLQAYQPTLMVFASSMLALQMFPILLGQYRELGYLRRLRTTPASPWQLLGAMLVLMLSVTMAVGVIMVAVPLVGRGREDRPGARNPRGLPAHHPRLPRRRRPHRRSYPELPGRRRRGRRTGRGDVVLRGDVVPAGALPGLARRHRRLDPRRGGRHGHG